MGGYVKHNRVHVFEDKRYRYDRFGRLSEKRIGSHTVQRFRYDAEQRLICVEQDQGWQRLRSEYRYDPLGRRIGKRVYRNDNEQAQSDVQFVWQGLRLLQEVEHGFGSVYVYADPDSYEPLARIDGKPGSEEIFYFHTNLAGLPEQLTDEAGLSVWHSEYEGWGKSRDEWHDQRVRREQNLRFQGQYLDRETGLHYNTFRFYDADVGRFTQPDPIGLLGGLNLYQYAPNPIKFTDPLGFAYDPIAALNELGIEGVKQTPGGGLDYKNSNALYNKPSINPVVPIKYTGDYALDTQAANKKAGLNQKSAPKGYVWHHVNDYDPLSNTGTVQLVKQKAHLGIKHAGGVSQYSTATGKKYTHPARLTKPKGPTRCP